MMNYTAHETAIIDVGAMIGLDSKIWHWVHVCSGARIGERCSLGQGVFVAAGAVIGNNVKVQNNVSIYDGVTLEDDVFCGPSAVFTNVRNPRSAVNRRGEYQKTLVKRGATLGANCTVVCGVTIGEYAFIAAGAVVNRDVQAYALMVGVPVCQLGWMSAHGERLDLPLTALPNEKLQAHCCATGELYVLRGDLLERQGAINDSHASA